MRIALTGLAGCGKSLAAAYLVGNYGFIRLSFAAKLKDLLQRVLDRPINKYKDRTLLQEFGCLLRKTDPDIWIHHLDLELSKLPSCTNIVIDDLRFLNEEEFLYEKGFRIVKISGRERIMSEKQKGHASEQDIKKIQTLYEIRNIGNFSHFFFQIEATLTEIIRDSNDTLFNEMYSRGINHVT